jgi:hypothetical protein
MCGIVGVVGNPGRRPAPDLPTLRETLARAEGELAAAAADEDRAPSLADLDRAAGTLRRVDRDLHELDGVGALIADPVARAALAHHAGRAAELLAEIEVRLDRSGVDGGDVDA